MDSLKINPAKPFIYFKVSGLWTDVSVDVLALAQPPDGETEPGETPVATLNRNGYTKKGARLPTKKTPDGTTVLDCIGLRFAMTTDPANIGTVQIEVRREQDKPSPPTWDAWPSQGTVTLARNDAGADIYVEQDIAVSKDSP
jgi:hypothetical protein